MKANKFMVVMALIFFGMLCFTLGYDTGIRQEPIWVQNTPLTTVVHKKKLCYQWEGDYKTQVVACIKRRGK